MGSFRIFALLSLLLVIACGDDEAGIGDDTTTGDMPGDTTGDDGTGDGDGDGDEDPNEPDAECGDAVVEGDEECDDGNTRDDDSCNADCTLTCGDGRLGSNERCDVGIETGDGACPDTCDDQNACTQDTLTGIDCEQQCVFAPITDPVDGDGCCPDGGNANNDSDCAPLCGNGVVEDGELCDTSIEAGNPGACPADCDDGEACTADVLESPGTCQAACANTEITEPADDDGCCPVGGNSNNDNDCSVSCGNGEVEEGEACDIAIGAGQPGACPTSCSDGDACTRDVLVSGGTCNAACSFPDITTPTDDDGCCPDGANSNNDNDCSPTCGNDVPEQGEDCDDGNTDDGDGCSSTCSFEATTYRVTDLDLRDPHIVAQVPIFGCRDVTDTPVPIVNFSVNGELQGAIDDLTLNLLTRLAPARRDVEGGEVSVIDGECSEQGGAVSCTNADPDSVSTSTFVNQDTGVCLSPVPNTTRPYQPAVQTPTNGCFASGDVEFVIDVVDIPIRLSGARVAAQYSGSPPTQLLTGLIIGFLSEEDATAELPEDFPIQGTIASLLVGGEGNCRTPRNGPSPNGDRDIGPDGVTTGWWFYLNFEAEAVPFTDQTGALRPDEQAALMSLP